VNTNDKRTPRSPAPRGRLHRFASKLAEKALDNIINLAIVAGISAIGSIGAFVREGWAHREIVLVLCAALLGLTLIAIAAAGAKSVRDRLREANEERIQSQQRFRYVEYQKELIYNALESIQQALAIDEDWHLDELVERGVLGPARGLLKREPLEDVRVAVLIADPDGESWRMRWAAGHRPEGVRNYHRPIPMTLAGQAYTRREVVAFDDVTQEAGFVRNPRATRDFRALVAAPLLINEKIVGALSVVSTEASAFNDDDISFVRIVAALIDVLLAAEDEARRFGVRMDR
jgi:hypothetical protein